MNRLFAMIMFVPALASGLFGQTQEPFKLGTFEERGRVFLGLVLRDNLVVDISQANAALDGVNSRMFFGEPFTLVVRDTVTPEEERALLAGTGILYVRESRAPVVARSA